MYSENKSIKEMRENIIKEISYWSLSKEKFLNIISPPYNLSEIFGEIILSFVKLNKKILYITNEEAGNIKIIENIKNKSDFKKYTYYKKNSDYKDSTLVISEHKIMNNIKEKFDLVIYDDIKSFSFYTNRQISKAAMCMCKNEGKIIAYSIERIFPNSREIVFPIRENCCPIIEPKFISTRINLNKDIPYVAYEYIKWSIETNRKVVVYVPSEDKVKDVYEYLSKYCSKFTRSTLSFIKSKANKKDLYNLKKIKDGIVITNNFHDIHFKLRNINVMVFFSDDSYFNYKKLVYLCAKVGKNENKYKGEVIFLGKYDTEDIDKAKDITRYFNKEAWEMNLLKI